MSDTGSEHPGSGMSDQIGEEHQEIHAMTREIQAARTLPDLLRKLETFQAAVRVHFSHEEAPGGFFEFIRSRSSWNYGGVHALEQEHREFLVSVAALEAKVREFLAGPFASLMAEAARLTEQLHRHEAEESRLLTETLYTDVGPTD